MQENTHSFLDTTSFIRHSHLKERNQTLVFLHGIGDSGLSYLPYLQSDILASCNVIVPDLLGHGYSSRADEYSYDLQVSTIISHLQALELEHGFPFNEIILIPHSMASIHALMMYQSELLHQIKGIIEVEGSITQYGSFISEKVSEVNAAGQFPEFYHQFIEKIIGVDYVTKFPFTRSYYDSLKLCDPKAFLDNALELQSVCHSLTGKYTNSAGAAFTAVKLPKIYCYGDNSLCKESVAFLQEYHLPTKIFHTNCHFIMQQFPDEFAEFVREWISNE
ncbi:MAG TPA: alpha/beta hydrolase [Gammaproteobacteria bacterium]|nr:alpha/beta hydrolase [Gammaproteobacteria bacterium]